MSDAEEVKSRLDIVDVVGQYVPLKKAGRTFKAPCPFHQEKTPSFTVSPERQTWHCFGACGTGGDVISFVMKQEGIEFPDALRQLAERAGIKLTERRASPEQDRARQRLYDANDAAAAYFQELLHKDAGKAALVYVENRGIDDATAHDFGLGYSAASWEACLEHLRDLRFSDREIVQAGLAIEGERGLHDRFRNRLMFPVWDAKGRIIGFGARALDDAMPKYLNTAQTSLFDKSGTLYALHKAQEAIRSEGRAVVVEGYMDVIAAHQYGFRNVVAQMGTALTERQVQILKKAAEQIVLALDADAAGTDAAVRGHDVVRESDGESAPIVSWRGLVGYQNTAAVDLRVVILPEGQDPDDVLRAEGDAWQKLIDEARPVLEFRLDVAAKAHDLTDPRGRSALVQEYLPLLGAVADPVLRAHYLQRLSRVAQVSEDELRAMVARTPRSGYPSRRPEPQNATKSAAGNSREGFLLALLLQYPHLRAEASDLPEELIWEEEGRQILRAWRKNPEIELKEAVPIELMDYLERLILWKLPISSETQASDALRDCVKKLDQRRLQAEKQAIAAQIADLQDAEGSLESDIVGSLDSQRVLELQRLQARYDKIDWELELQKRRTDGREAVESLVDG